MNTERQVNVYKSGILIGNLMVTPNTTLPNLANSIYQFVVERGHVNYSPFFMTLSVPQTQPGHTFRESIEIFVPNDINNPEFNILTIRTLRILLPRSSNVDPIRIDIGSHYIETPRGLAKYVG